MQVTVVAWPDAAGGISRMAGDCFPRCLVEPGHFDNERNALWLVARVDRRFSQGYCTAVHRRP